MALGMRSIPVAKRLPPGCSAHQAAPGLPLHLAQRALAAAAADDDDKVIHAVSRWKTPQRRVRANRRERDVLRCCTLYFVREYSVQISYKHANQSPRRHFAAVPYRVQWSTVVVTGEKPYGSNSLSARPVLRVARTCNRIAAHTAVHPNLPHVRKTKRKLSKWA